MNARHSDFEMDDGRDEIDLGGVAAALGRRKRLILSVMLGAAAAAAVFVMVVKPRYVAESRVLVENQESYFTSAGPDGSRAELSDALDESAINSQIQILTSRDLARRVVSELHLQGNPEFDPAAGGLSFLKRPLVLLGLMRGPADQPVGDRLLNNFIDHQTVMSPSKSRVLQIEFSSRDPELAARGANALAELYIDMKSQAKRAEAHQAAEALKPLIASLETKVADADAKVEAFRAQTGLYESAGQTMAPTQQLGEIVTRLAQARAAQSDAQATAQTLRDLLKTGRLSDAGDIAKSDLMRRIADQRVAVRAQLAAELRTLLPGHPRIKELEGRLSDLDAQMRAALDKAARGYEDDARVAAARVVNLESLLEAQKGAVGAANADGARLLELQRESKTLKDQLASLSAKYQAALSRDLADSAPADARIISRALAPSQPAFPKKAPIIIFATLAGLFFPVAFVIAGEITGGRRKIAAPAPAARREQGSIGDLRRAVTDFGASRPATASQPGIFQRLWQAAAEFSAPAVALEETPAPRDEAQDDAPVAVAPEKDGALERTDAPGSPLQVRTGAARALVKRLAETAACGGAKIMVVSDPDSSHACAALALARALAREGRAILVQIDDSDRDLADELESALADDADDELFDDVQPGLAQLLSGEASFAETIYRDGASRLHIIQSGGPVEAAPADIDLVLDALHATYDFALVATGAGDEAARIARQADLTLIYAEDARARSFLSDDFAAAGARSLVLAGRDSFGEIVEMAA